MGDKSKTLVDGKKVCIFNLAPMQIVKYSFHCNHQALSM